MLPISVPVLPSFPSLQSHRYDNQVLHEWILKWKLLLHCYNTDFTERWWWQKVDVFFVSTETPKHSFPEAGVIVES
jgi:hypothetical protein